jgi:chemotaxis protein MotB
MAQGSEPIIVKKINKGGHAAHGGAWKVAYADFVTAMMAFFLLLWLLNSASQEQLEGISNYFAPISISSSTSGSGEMFGGKVMGEEGAMPDVTSRPSVVMDMPPPKAGSGGDAPETDKPTEKEPVTDEATAEATMAKKEEEQFKEAEGAMREAMKTVPQLQQLAKSLLIDNTPEGLRIQIVDQEGLAMFPGGSADMYPRTRKVLELVSKVIMSMPQKVAIAGHTDATKFVSQGGYSNWELSADRANASRRVLLNLGVPVKRIARVVGMAANEPLLTDDPANARNRRISLTLLRGSGRPPKVEMLPPVPDGAAPVPDAPPVQTMEMPPPAPPPPAPASPGPTGVALPAQ